MSGKGARSIELPIYVVNIGLLYAFLLTSGLVLAWVTIYRHEQSIAELRILLKDQSQAANTAGHAAREKLFQKEHEKEMDDGGPRVRRGKEKNSREVTAVHAECNVKCVGEKGERGEKGEKGPKGKKGRRGRSGENGTPGPPGPPGYPGVQGHQGERGYDGRPGAKGNMGEKGERGKDGNDGLAGEKGDTGVAGNPGEKGSKGDRGSEGITMMHSESAHIVGTGEMVSSDPAPGDVYLIRSWKRQHTSGNMDYDNNGHLTVKVPGVYVVYSQMFYFDRDNTYTGYNVYIDQKRILKTIYSIVDYHKPYHTQYVSGVFKIAKGQKIWVGTTIKRNYFYNESSSFFGAFMLHP